MERFIDKVFKMIELIILLATLILLIFREYISNFIVFKTDDILILLVGVIAANILNDHLNNKSILRKLNIEKAVTIAPNTASAYATFLKKKHYKKVRIYAVGSNTVQPQFNLYSDLYIEKCFLLVRKLEAHHALYKAESEAEIAVVIQRWKMMVDDGRIGSLEIVFYDNCINSYWLIADEEILMTDFLVYNELDTLSQSTVDHYPILFHNNSNEGKEIILRSILQFDNHFEQYKRTGNYERYISNNGM